MIILYKILINAKSKFFFDDENTKIFFTMAKYTVGSHVDFFYSDIIENEFIVNDIDKELYEKELKKYIDLYCYSKKIYSTLKRFFRNIRLKKFAKKYEMDTDLYFNKLSNFPENQKITILENNTLYTFRLSDLIVIIKDSLINNDGLFPLPNSIKNPYTNINFSIPNLYNIYFALLNSTYNIPLIINQFFYVNFDLKLFVNKFYPFLKDISIKKFVEEGSVYEQYEYIENLFFEFRKDIEWAYLPRRESLRYSELKNYCNMLNKTLFNYLMFKYSNNNYTRDSYKIITMDSLKQFVNDNKNLTISTRSNVRNTLRRRRTRTSEIQYPPPPPPTSQNILTVPPPPPSQNPPPPPTIERTNYTRNQNNFNTRSTELNNLIQEIDLSVINSNVSNPFIPSTTLPRTPTNFIR